MNSLHSDAAVDTDGEHDNSRILRADREGYFQRNNSSA